MIALLFAACGKKSNFTIQGKMEGGAGKTIYLNYLLNNSQSFADSAKMGKDGSFELRGKVSGPTYFLLKLTGTNFVTLLPDSAENITVTGTYDNFSRDYVVTGSDNSSKVRDLTIRFAEVKPRLDSLRQLYRKHENDPGYTSDLERWNNQYVKEFNDYTAYVNEFVKKNPFSMACVYALYQKWDENNYVASDFQAMRSAASALYAIYPKNEQVKALYTNTLNILKQQNNSKLSSLISENAINSPDIKLPDAYGVERNLWSLHGKHVLLHFWSAKDRTSRIQNQVLVELYAKYKSRGFEIYMVSVDDDATAWKTAIEEDRLNWINVGDMKGSVQAVISYNIRTIPANYLLDKEGKIIGKNLQGPDLTNTLAKVL
jgi:peroxiredoxin